MRGIGHRMVCLEIFQNENALSGLCVNLHPNQKWRQACSQIESGFLFLFNRCPERLRRATYPCAFAYNYARIRRLVRLAPGLYRFPATAHQWSGLVALVGNT